MMAIRKQTVLGEGGGDSPTSMEFREPQMSRMYIPENEVSKEDFLKILSATKKKSHSAPLKKICFMLPWKFVV